MIHKLPEDIIRRIAAGEVVDHPSSIIKELVENALDAGSSDVKVSIYGGGKSRIVVDDNGAGMGEEDLALAVLPHTTSKIESFDDIFNLSTFGFRGEAIASIGAVSKMKIESSNSNDGTGYGIDVVGGIVSEVFPVAKSKGTRVTVSDLFFNVPVRRKFLSSTSIEGRMATEIVEKFILAKDISISYYRDDQPIYKVAEKSSLKDRVKKITGVEELISVDEQIGGIRIHGYLSVPYVGMQNRLDEIIFVNGRYVKSPLLMKAIEAGYAEHLKKGEFPVAVIFLNVPPQIIDVNIHPQKLEVKFSDQSRIFGMIAGTVKKALASPSIFTLPMNGEVTPKEQQEEHKAPFYPHDTLSGFEENNSGRLSDRSFETFDFDMHQSVEKESVRESLSKTKILGILKGRYLICEGEEALYIIDIHATHERIIFDKLKVRQLSSQRLISPVKISLTEVQRDVFKQYKAKIKEFGFEFEDGALTCVPSIDDVDDWKETFISTVESFRLSFARDPKEAFFADVACKMAVKTGEKISPSELSELLSDLDNLETWSCPHGRPLVYSLEFKRLDRYFGR
jgi:DNA mismatch repair protein MutL